MSERFVDEVGERLRSLGVRGADAERVLAEVRDHLQEAQERGEEATRRFGEAARFARLVAHELATTRTRRATFVAFAALALAGACYALLLALVDAAGGWQDVSGHRLYPFGPLLAIALVLLPQIAFVSGCLALLRAWRLGGTRTAGAADLALVRRRTNVALAATAGALLALGLLALDSAGTLAAWWTWSAAATCAFLLAPLAGASYVVSDSACPAAAPGGPAGDVFDDLGPVLRIGPLRRLRLEAHPWRFAVISAVAVGLLGVAGGWYAEGDPGSGIVRGAFEAIALVICFAALGKALGLRRSNG
jgi:hypothetical protein